MGWHVVLTQNPPISPQYWPFPSHSFKQFSQDFNIIVLNGSLATGHPLCHHNTQDIKENSQHGLELRRTTYVRPFYALGETGDF